MEDEQWLVQRAQESSEQFSTLYFRYIDRIYAYVQRETGDTAVTEDIVSATFEKALKNLPGYQWQGVSFGAWLYKIARNEINTHYRKGRWTIPLLDRFIHPTQVEHVVQANDQMDEISLAIQQLSARDQEIIRLHYFEELTHTELAEVLGCSTYNVAVRLHRALTRLRKQLNYSAQEVVINA